jgi:hypothetical protein
MVSTKRLTVRLAEAFLLDFVQVRKETVPSKQFIADLFNATTS